MNRHYINSARVHLLVLYIHQFRACVCMCAHASVCVCACGCVCVCVCLCSSHADASTTSRIASTSIVREAISLGCRSTNLLLSDARSAIDTRPCVWCVAVCCGVLWCVTVCCSVMQCCGVLIDNRPCVWCVAVCCSVLQRLTVCCSVAIDTHPCI